jgi:hypothetical protein
MFSPRKLLELFMFLFRHTPERATISLSLKPFPLNMPIRFTRLVVALGISLSARLRLAVVESLLPSLTVHDGPPTCIIDRNRTYN